jgi:hypothetical protein
MKTKKNGKKWRKIYNFGQVIISKKWKVKKLENNFLDLFFHIFRRNLKISEFFFLVKYLQGMKKFRSKLEKF